jgi:hypothetical protein
MEGQRFFVLQGGKERITIRLADGTSTRIPRDWTDADGVVSSVKTRDGFYSVESLRETIELVDAFLRRQCNGVP